MPRSTARLFWAMGRRGARIQPLHAKQRVLINLLKQAFFFEGRKLNASGLLLWIRGVDF
jgi:hypothetical protein